MISALAKVLFVTLVVHHLLKLCAINSKGFLNINKVDYLVKRGVAKGD
jgi:hypothetical protein